MTILYMCRGRKTTIFRPPSAFLQDHQPRPHVTKIALDINSAQPVLILVFQQRNPHQTPESADVSPGRRSLGQTAAEPSRYPRAESSAGPMLSIVLLAEEPEFPRLKAALDPLGHRVVPLPYAPSSSSPIDLSPLSGDSFDLVFIDLRSLPEVLGNVIGQIQGNGSTREVPIVALVDESGAPDLDFELDFADFLTKPLRPQEVAARIRRLTHQVDEPDDARTIKVRDLAINQDRYEVRVKGVAVDMTLKEYELLKHLVANAGRVFTRADLLDSIWGYDYYGGMRTVDVHIRRLRSKLGDMGAAINTVRGVGYSFEPT